MNIQWFPGHMAKTRRLIEENLKLVDICIEIVDARLILSSKSPLVDELISSKPRLVIVNKADLADESVNKLWETYFKENKINAVFVNSRDGGKLLNLISGKINQILADEIKKWNEKGMSGRNVRAMVTGVPNVGKSTFINNLSGKKSANNGLKPAKLKCLIRRVSCALNLKMKVWDCTLRFPALLRMMFLIQARFVFFCLNFSEIIIKTNFVKDIK